MKIILKHVSVMILICITAAILCRPLQAADSTATQPKGKSPTGALLRSLVIPGWGQLYNGKYLKALIYAGAQVSFAYAAHVQNNRYHDYLNTDEVVAEFYKDDRNRMLWWLFGITLLSIGDAYVDAHLWNFDVSDNLSANITPRFDPENQSVEVSCVIHLNKHQ